MLSKICPRCTKIAKKDLDGFSCITCGWTEYIINKTPKKVRGSVPYIDKHYLPYKGHNPKYSRKSVPLITLLYQSKKKRDKLYYFMDCPLDDCNKLTVGRKSWQYSLRNREEDYFKFLCKAKHLWYLVVLNGEPLHWLSNDLEINNGNKKNKKGHKEKTHTPKSIQEIPKRR